MKTNKDIIIYLSLGSLLLLNLFLIYTSYSSKKRIAYVSVSELINNFTYTHELDKKYKEITEEKEAVIDNMKKQLYELSIRSDNPTAADIEEYRTLELNILKKTDEFNYENTLLQENYYQLMVERLNVYVHEYGTLHGKTLILGSTDNGNIMYAKEKTDITEDVITFINSRYEGE